MKKERIKIFCILIFLFFVSSTLAQSNLGLNEDELERLKLGKLSEELINKINSLSPEIKNLFIKDIILSEENSYKVPFLKALKEIDAKNKRSLLDDLTDLNRENLIKDYVKEIYGIDFNGFGHESIKLGDDGIIGNAQTYFDLEKISEYNEKNPNNKIKKVDYKLENGVISTVFTKENGNSLKLNVNEEKKGFYFDPTTNQILNVDENSNPNQKSSHSIQWNGRGNLIVDATKKELKMSLGYSKDENGDIISNDYATLKLSNGDEYSVYQRKIGTDESGADIYAKNDGSVTLNDQGKPTNLNNIYRKGDWGGFFGENTQVIHNLDDYNSLSLQDKEKLGSYLVVDEEKGIVTGDVAREQGGPAKDLKNVLDKIENKLREQLKSMEVESLNQGLFVARDLIQTGGDIEKSKELLQERIRNHLSQNFFNKDFSELGELESDSIIELSKTENIERMKSLIKLSNTGVSGVNNFLEKNPLLITNLPKEGSFMNLEFDNNFAKKINNVDLRAGTLKIEDNKGQMINVIESATPTGYKLNSDFNKNKPSFSGVNFNLIHTTLDGEVNQQIRIHSDNYGKLNAVGVGKLEGIQIIGTETFYGKGTVYLGPRGGIVISQTEPLVSATLSGSKESSESAKQYLDQKTKEYTQLYNQYKEGGITKDENLKLNALAKDITQGYYRELMGGDIHFKIDAIGEKSSAEFPKGMRQLADNIDSFISQADNTPNSFPDELKQAVISTIGSDKSFQEQLTQRRLTETTSLQNAVSAQMKDVSDFLRSNQGYSIEFVEDSRNKLYQLKYGTNTLNIDPALGPAVSSLLPIIIGSGGINSNGNFYIDNAVWDNRFQNQKVVVASGAVSHRLIGANKNRAIIEESIKNQVQANLIEYFKSPRN
jgi:hypothetical protein